MMTKRRLFNLAAGALVAWSVFAFALEMQRSGWLVAHDPWQAERPSTWRFESSQVAGIRAFAIRLETRLEAGSSLAVASPPQLGGEGFFHFLWLAYLLPEYRVGPANPSFEADYLAIYGAPSVQGLGLEPLFQTPTGALYRVERPR